MYERRSEAGELGVPCPVVGRTPWRGALIPDVPLDAPNLRAECIPPLRRLNAAGPVRMQRVVSAHDTPIGHGETRQWEQLYEEHQGVLYRYIASQVESREEAEDLAAQVWFQAVRKLDHARDRQSIQSWLYRVARTTMADYWRAFYKRRTSSLETLLEQGWEVPTQVEGPAGYAEERVQRILDQLPSRYREVLTWRFLRQCSLQETAEQMGLTQSNVKILQLRALKKAAQIR